MDIFKDSPIFRLEPPKFLVEDQRLTQGPMISLSGCHSQICPDHSYSLRAARNSLLLLTSLYLVKAALSDPLLPIPHTKKFKVPSLHSQHWHTPGCWPVCLLPGLGNTRMADRCLPNIHQNILNEYLNQSQVGLNSLGVINIKYNMWKSETHKCF